MDSTNHTFMDSYLAGDASLNDIDDWVEIWHNNPQGKTLDEFLGFNEVEASYWAVNPLGVPDILNARKLDIPVSELKRSGK